MYPAARSAWNAPAVPFSPRDTDSTTSAMPVTSICSRPTMTVWFTWNCAPSVAVKVALAADPTAAVQRRPTVLFELPVYPDSRKLESLLSGTTL